MSEVVLVSQDGDPKVTTTVLVGIIGVILMLVVVIFTIAIFHNVEYVETVRKVHARPYHEVRTLDAEQQENLHSYRWINEREGVVGIPIGRAIALTARDLSHENERATINQTHGTSDTPSAEDQ